MRLTKQAVGMLLAVFALFSEGIAAWEAKAETVRITVLPCSDVVKTFERFQPLAAYIEEETGLDVETVFPERETDLVRLFRQRYIDFIFHSPSSFPT